MISPLKLTHCSGFDALSAGTCKIVTKLNTFLDQNNCTKSEKVYQNLYLEH